MCGLSICPSIYLSIAGKEKRGRKEYIKESRKGDFETRDLCPQGMVTDINDGS